MCLAWEGKTDGEGRVSEGKHAAACRGGKRDPWCGGTDAGSQPAGGRGGHGHEFAFDPEKLRESQGWDIYGI